MWRTYDWKPRHPVAVATVTSYFAHTCPRKTNLVSVAAEFRV